MSARDRQQPLSRRVLVPAMWIVLIVAMAVTGYCLFDPLVRKNIEMIRREYVLRGDLDAVEKENAALREEVKKITESPIFVEKVAREELGMGKPGEVVYRFKSGEQKGGT